MSTDSLRYGPTLEQRKQHMASWKSLSEQYGISLSFARFLRGQSFRGEDICQEYLQNPTKAFGPDAYALLGYWSWLDLSPKKEWRAACSIIRVQHEQDDKEVIEVHGSQKLTKWGLMAYSRHGGEYGCTASRGVLAPDELPQPIRTAIKAASQEIVNLDMYELYFLPMFGFCTPEEVRKLAVRYPYSGRTSVKHP